MLGIASKLLQETLKDGGASQRTGTFPVQAIELYTEESSQRSFLLAAGSFVSPCGVMGQPVSGRAPCFLANIFSLPAEIIPFLEISQILIPASIQF